MRLSGRRRDRVVLTLLFGTSAILLVVSLVLWRQGSDADSDRRSTTPDASGEALEGPSLSRSEPVNEADAGDEVALKELLPSSLTVSNGQGAKHRVTVTADSGGYMYLGYLFRDGKGAGVYVKNRSFQATETLRGELPAAVIAIQVIDRHSVTCTVRIDGKKVASDTATKPGSHALCAA